MLNALVWNLLLTAGMAIVLAALCRLPSLRRRPAMRYWLWLLLLAKLVTPPLIAVPLLPAVAGGDDVAAIAVPTSKPMEYRESALDQRRRAKSADDDTPFARAGRGAMGVASGELGNRAQAVFFGGLFAVSLIGTCVLLTVHGAHGAKLYRWLRRAGTENILLAEACADVALRLEIRGVVRSCVVDTRTTPLLWGWHRPMVVMPRQLISDLSPQQLRSIVAHELAHFLRRDHWANLFVFIVKALLWWNPVVWWADRELRSAQELCCDAIAIDYCNTDRRGYAKTLLKALDFIQMEPLAPRALALGIGSRGSILRRFEMIGETRLSYQLSRWTFLALLVLAIPLVCIPVRGQEKGPAAPSTPAASDAGAAKTAADAKDKNEGTAEAKPAKTGAGADTQPIDPKIKELGDAARKRISTWSDEETLILKDGQTGRMKVKKNITPAAEILITPHFVENGTKFDLEGVDAIGQAIEGTKTDSGVIHNAQASRMGLGKTFLVDGENIFAKIQLQSTRRDDNSVAVEVKAFFTRLPTSEEMEAMLQTEGKDGQLQLNFQKISPLVMQYKLRTGRYPKDLADLKQPLPKDVYSPTGEDYHYEAQRNRFILSSCGKDGIYGNDDDEILIVYSGGMTSGQRHELYPLEEEKNAAAQTETVLGERPRGNCSISGKVVSAATGEPIEHARMYLHYGITHGSIFINTASDGTFTFKDIPKGPYSLQECGTAGYQYVAYNPDGKPLPYPSFSLEDGEHRSGIVLKAERACRISGKILDENGKRPENIDTLTVLAWFEKKDGKVYESEQARVNQADGSYSIDGLGSQPVYVMAINWRAAREGNAYPPIYYPGTFSRSEAKQITFDKEQRIDNINITLQKEGGFILEGTVRDEAGEPVPEAFIVVHRRDMLFDFVTAYTDEQGHCQIQGLGDGEFLVHVDAVHRGFVRMRTPLDLDKTSKKTQLNFTLNRGVLISGKFVDEKGNDWRIGTSYGFANISKDDLGNDQQKSDSGFSLTNFRNKHRPKDALESSGGSFALGEGGYEDGEMIFPTTSTFVIQGMMPGQTKIGFSPNKEGQKVAKILYNGRDIMESGIETKPGQEIKDVTIVIGKE
ncbi:MAG: M56 family metallopeptidase [Thermoguttaceae bacterium]